MTVPEPLLYAGAVLPPAPSSVATPPELEHVACNLCGADDAAPLWDRARWGQTMRNVVCRRCGLVYATPRLTREPLDRFYRDLVYPEFVDRHGRFTHRLIASSRDAAARTFAYFSGALPGPLAGRRLLEIGPGLGDFLLLAREAGADVLGVELDGLYADFAERERGVPVLRRHVEDLDADDTFDVIAMFHVLEHLADPAGTLRRLRARLAPGGHLLVEVPNFMGPWRMLPTDFFRIEHTYNFSPATLDALLATAGFTARAHDGDPFLLRVVAQPSAAGRQVALPEAHYAEVRRHFLTWRARARLFAPYYALRARLRPTGRRR